MSAMSQASPSPPPPSPGHPRGRMRKIENRREREVLRFLPQLYVLCLLTCAGITVYRLTSCDFALSPGSMSPPLPPQA